MRPDNMNPERGYAFWLFGLSGAGKSTLAGRLAAALRAEGRVVLALDGDVLRHGLCHGLGFSDEDRAENLRRAAETARLGLDSGLCVVASFITPLERNRAAVRATAGAERIALVHVDAPLEVCRTRDVKGLYARAAAGQVPQMTGLSSAFEPPRQADLVLATGTETVEFSVQRLVTFARDRLSAQS
ncbi:MAG TPA: adenylyl-sulfate kinase [Candidatus Didemnitutus sp.]|nr:adenylyl-sulfate kinase [Candidatus Didemnitutus sp.]